MEQFHHPLDGLGVVPGPLHPAAQQEHQQQLQLQIQVLMETKAMVGNGLDSVSTDMDTQNRL